MKRRFIVIVLDGFGMGAQKDAAIKRPGDERACTIGSILGGLADCPVIAVPTSVGYGAGKRNDEVQPGSQLRQIGTDSLWR